VPWICRAETASPFDGAAADGAAADGAKMAHAMAQNIRLLMDQSTAPVMGHLTAKKIVQGR